MSNSNYDPMLHRFGDMATYRSKIVEFTYRNYVCVHCIVSEIEIVFVRNDEFFHTLPAFIVLSELGDPIGIPLRHLAVYRKSNIKNRSFIT